MISVAEARDIILNTAKDFGTEKISLNEGIGRVLREDWHCDRDMPPYDRVTMDGIALNYEVAHGKSNSSLQVLGVVGAGDPHTTLTDKEGCLEVMTGAMLPIGADTVIRYEDIEIKDGIATINADYRHNQNIHWQGEDRKQGDLLVPSGTKLSGSEIGVGASIGRSEIIVSRLPKSIVISTGNELVEVDQIPLPHQIRRGNVYRIQSILNQLGIACDTAHILDDKEETEKRLSQYINEYELIILSGGVSKGKFDFLPNALEQSGVQKQFHRVAQRPGKPLWFGVHPKGTTVFALPGNPISSFMCLMIYVVGWLNKCIGLSPNAIVKAVLSEDVSFKPALTYFLEVGLTYGDDGRLMATPKKGNGSGDLANLLNADAFIELPMGQEVYKKGGVYKIYNYR